MRRLKYYFIVQDLQFLISMFYYFHYHVIAAVKCHSNCWRNLHEKVMIAQILSYTIFLNEQTALGRVLDFLWARFADFISLFSDIPMKIV